MFHNLPSIRVQHLLVLLFLVPGWMAAGDLTADAASMSASQIIRVGPHRTVKRIVDAMRSAKNGDVIEIDAGSYTGDVGTWTQDNLTIRAVHGRARIVQLLESAEEKALWVIKGDRVVIENIEFAGARVPDRNGAGIRHEGGRLTVRNCLFERNEMGLLTWNDQSAELIIEASEFRDNAVAGNYRLGDPIGHKIYVGAISRFTLRESYIHQGAYGHLVKSRATENRIENNRITDEFGGHSSYELEFPNGGIAYVIGNIVEQSAATQNQDMISYGAEGYRWSRNELYVVANTLVDDLPRRGIFVRVRGPVDHVVLGNNLLLGEHALNSEATWTVAGNALAKPGDVPLASRMDYRLHANSPLVGAAADLTGENAGSLRPEREYVHPMQSRVLPAGSRSPGALQGVVR